MAIQLRSARSLAAVSLFTQRLLWQRLRPPLVCPYQTQSEANLHPWRWRRPHPQIGLQIEDLVATSTLTLRPVFTKGDRARTLLSYGLVGTAVGSAIALPGPVGFLTAVACALLSAKVLPAGQVTRLTLSPTAATLTVQRCWRGSRQIQLSPWQRWQCQGKASPSGYRLTLRARWFVMFETVQTVWLPCRPHQGEWLLAGLRGWLSAIATLP